MLLKYFKRQVQLMLYFFKQCKQIQKQFFIEVKNIYKLSSGKHDSKRHKVFFEQYNRIIKKNVSLTG